MKLGISFFVCLCLFAKVSDSRLIPMTTKKTYKSMLRIADFAFIPPLSDDAEAGDGKFHLWEGMSKVKRSAFTFVVRYNVSVPLDIVVFYENAMYQELIKEKYTCYDRAAYARANGNVFRLDRYIKHDENDNNVKEGWVTAKESLGFSGSRPRWYYFFLMNCQDGPCNHPNGWCQGPIDVEYTLLLTNGVGYMKHFSADEVGILPTAITFGILYILLTLYAFTCIVRPLQTQRKLHWTVIMFVLSLFIYTVSMWFDTADLAEEGSVGQRLPACQMIAITLRIFSESLTLLTAILLAKGWTVVRRKISAKGRVKIAIFMTTYIIAGLFSVGAQFTRSGDFLFRTPTDRLLDWGWYQFTTRLFAFVWFTYAIFTTTKYDSFGRFRCFFKTLYCTFGPWILALPLSMLIGLSMPSYYRARWMYAMEIGSAFLGHLVMAFIFRPSKYNASFPFAFRTAAMEAKDRWIESRKNATEKGEEKHTNGMAGGRSTTHRPRLPRDNVASIQNGRSVAETSYGLTNASGSGSTATGNVSSDVRRRRPGPSAQRGALSGGLQVDTPQVRVQNLASSLRKKLGVVFEVADQLEEELTYVFDEEEENGAMITEDEQ